MGAGRLDRRLTFQKPGEVEDGAGNYNDGFVTQFTVAANVKFMRGTETVMASRLQGVSPAIVTIRASTAARGVGPDWRILDERAGVDAFGKPAVVYQVKEFPRETDDRGYLEMLISRGVER